MKYLILFLFLAGCTTITSVTSKPIHAVKYTGHGSAFQAKYKGKVYMITAAHVCHSDKTMVVDKKSYKLHKLNVMDDICVLTGPIQRDMRIFELSEKPVKPGRELTISGFPLVRAIKPITNKVLSGFRSVKITRENTIIRGQEIYGRVIIGNSGGPAYIGNTVYGMAIRGDAKSRGQMVTSRLITKTISGLTTLRECPSILIKGNVPVNFIYNMFIPACLRKEKSCVHSIEELAPLNYRVLCKQEVNVGG